MNKLYTKQEITQMLARFMAGESTLEEEEALAQYFRTHEVEDEWREYKEMFGLFDEGKVEPLSSPPQRKSLTPPLRREWGFAPLCGARATFSGSSKDPSRPLRGELKRSVFPFLWRGIGGGLIAACIALMIGFSWLKKEDAPAVEEPVVAQVPAEMELPEKERAVAEEPQESREAEKPAESATPKRHESSLSPGRGRGVRLDEELPSIPPEKQALVDIYLAEEALQVAYELQAQEEELRAYAASLTGQELPETVIAF